MRPTNAKRPNIEVALFLALLAFLFTGGTRAPAGDTGPGAEEAEKPRFQRIFNGKNLTGWKGDERIWSVRDGAITGQTTEDVRVQKNNFLVWQGGEFGDFELYATFRLVGGNSGIYYRSHPREEGEPFVGPQADVSANHEWTGDIMEYTLRGILAERGQKVRIDENGKKEIEVIGDPKVLLEHYREEDWNEYHVTAIGGHVVLEINGVKMCELIDNDPRRPKKGLLAVQVHVGPPMLVQFKDLRLRILD